MKKILFLFPALFLLLFSCSNAEEENATKTAAVTLHSFKDKLSYSLGADHARSISSSEDSFLDKYDIDAIVKGFEEGFADTSAFDENCKQTMMKLYGADGKSFDASHAKEGSNCLGKLSGKVFKLSWEKKGALSKIDIKKASSGFRDGLLRADTLIDEGEQAEIIQNFFQDLNIMNGAAMMEKAKKLPNAKITASGIVIETLQEGKGGSPEPGGDVLAHYILMNSLGDTLQSSFDMMKMYNQPLNAFSLTGVVAGWQEGMPLLKKGGKYRLYIPYQLGWGEQGMFNPQNNAYDIQPYESIVFYIELINYGKPGALTKNNVNR